MLSMNSRIFDRNYKGLIQLPTIKERFEYLRLNGKIGDQTFGGRRYLNQALYMSDEWRSFRNKVIIRDDGCDMAMPGYSIMPAFYNKKLKGREDYIIIHHINPLSVEDIQRASSAVFDMNNVVCVSHRTHMAIHYGDERLLPQDPVVRRPNDTSPWRIGG